MKKIVLMVLALSWPWVASVQAAETEPFVDEAAMELAYYQPLAEGGSPYAQLTMGEIYMEGRGVKRDLVTAYAWFYVAVQQGVDEADGVMKEILRRLSEGDKTQAEALGREFVKAYSYQ